jgi:hypothetical protein
MVFERNEQNATSPPEAEREKSWRSNVPKQSVIVDFRMVFTEQLGSLRYVLKNRLTPLNAA